MYRFWLTVVLALCAAESAHAQASEVPSVGARVRVTAPTVSSERLIGTLVGVTEGEFVLQVGETGEARIPREAVTRLEVSRGVRSRTARGAGLGVLIGGAALGALLALPRCFPGEGGPCDHTDPRAGRFFVGYLVGGLPGALLGAIIGSQVRTDDWAEVPLSDIRISASLAGGVGVGIEVPTPW